MPGAKNMKDQQLWKLRKSTGRHALYETKAKLWRKCVKYFDWVEANPLQKTELVKYEGKAKQISIPVMRAMTIRGLCLFLDISRETWHNYRADKRGDEDGHDREYLAETCSKVEDIIYEQKFTGAAADLLNVQIISSELELKERHELSGSIDVMIKDLTDEDIDDDFNL